MTTPWMNEDILAGRLPLLVVGGMASALPLEHTNVHAQINGEVASVLVSQRFGNPLSLMAELEYLYPLPHEAAVTDFKLHIGARVILGDIQELKKAQTMYEEALESGQRAGMLDQRRPNLFGLRLGNIQPGETITAEVRYQQRLTFSADGYEFVFPMGLTPKYDNPVDPDEGAGTHAPVAHLGEVIGPVEISVAVDAGLACSDPSSPSHPLEVARLDERRFHLRLAGEHIPDHDFVLRYAVSGDLPTAAAWSSPAADGSAYFMATILPPRPECEPLALRREFVFVLDRSGSMGGEPIEQARNALRACLRALNPQDAFHVLLFDDRMEWYRETWSEVTQESIDRADAFLAQVDARGGTEIVTALELALGLPADRERIRYIVFLTDGAVSAETRTLETLRKKLGTARIFTFGIGPSVNRALLTQMARFGRGQAEFLQANEDIEGAIIRFQDRVSFPALMDMSLTWKEAYAWDVYPERLPDLYIGQPLTLCGRWKPGGQAPAVLLVRGKRGDQAFEAEVRLDSNAAPDAAIGRVWARARVDELTTQAAFEPGKAESIRSAVIALALEHRLVTEYTAFVGVDEQVVAQDKDKRVLIRVAQPLPEGVEMDVIHHLPPTIFGLQSVRSAPPPSPAQAAFPAPRAMSAAPTGRASLKRMKQIQEPSGLSAIFGAGVSGPDENISAPKVKLPATRDEALRLLARTQRLDGSWGGDVEQTAAALLAMVRGGHTDRAGSFRQVVRRAIAWLKANPGSGSGGFARARALAELAQASGDPAQAGLAQQAVSALPAPTGPFEAACLAAGRPVGPAMIDSFDTLRLAALAGDKRSVPAEILQGELAVAWAALVL